MKRHTKQAAALVTAISFACFVLGVVLGWWARSYIGTANPEKGPFSLLLVAQPTIPNHPRYRPGPEPPKNTPEVGLTAPIARLTGVGKGVGLVTRVGSPRRLLDPAQAPRRETLSGPPISHRTAP